MKKKKRKSSAVKQPSGSGPASPRSREEPPLGSAAIEESQTDLPIPEQQLPGNETIAERLRIVQSTEVHADSGGSSECPVDAGSGLDREQATEDQQVALCTPDEAKRVLERFFTVLVMANLAVHVTLKPFCGQRIPMDKVEALLQQAGLVCDLLPIEVKAFRSVAPSDHRNGEEVDVQSLFDQASAIAFRVEMCELQIRAAILEHATGSKAAKAKIDVQRTITRLVSHLPAEASAQITSRQFESILEEKLGLTPGSFLAKIVFARIIKRPFQRSFPRVLGEAKAAFCEALEGFCVYKPLSLDSVEGQLRQLVIKHPNLLAAFQQMDLDGSGTISTPEFVVFLQREGQMHVPDDVLKAFIKRFDIDGDGTLNYEEFIEFVRPKQFGIHVLTPFGMFYLALDRLDKMGNVVEKIKTRMFWMQHNDLSARTSAASSNAPAIAARTKAEAASTQRNQPISKLNGTDRFVLTHHFGTVRLEFEPKDQIVNVLANGELVVLILCNEEQSMTAKGSGRDAHHPLPPFEYRLKPTSKRNLLPLFSTTEMLKQQQSAHRQTSSLLDATGANDTGAFDRNLSVTRKTSASSSTSSRNYSRATESSRKNLRRGTQQHRSVPRQQGEGWDAHSRSSIPETEDFSPRTSRERATELDQCPQRTAGAVGEEFQQHHISSRSEKLAHANTDSRETLKPLPVVVTTHMSQQKTSFDSDDEYEYFRDGDDHDASPTIDVATGDDAAAAAAPLSAISNAPYSSPRLKEIGDTCVSIPLSCPPVDVEDSEIDDDENPPLYEK